MADWAQKNRDHFNETASTYNSRFGKTILQLIEEIQARKDWIGVDWVTDVDEDSTSPSSKTVRLLDYACGTGLVSRALAPYITQSLGVDLSSAMVNEYNTSAHNQGIPESEMHAVVGNLIDSSTAPGPEFAAPEFFDFDVAAVGMGWHHFTEPAYAAKKLSERLKIGGVLLIVDFLPHEGFGHGRAHGHDHSHGHGGHAQGHEHEHGEEKKQDGEKLDGYADEVKLEKSAAHTVIHHGFSEEVIKKMYEDAGVGSHFKFVVLGKGVVFESQGKSQSRRVFMARGRKA